MHTPHLLPIASCLFFAACLPAVLEKYRQPHPENRKETSTEDPLLPRSSEGGVEKAGSLAKPSKNQDTLVVPSRERPTIYAINQTTYRFLMRENDIWDTVLNVLLRNYILTIVDRSSGVITTDWDSFFLGKEVYRNRLSLRMTKSGRDQIDLMIHNDLERLRDASQTTSAIGAVWLPAEDDAQEIRRIVQNMALILGEPPPVNPPASEIAKTIEKTEDNALR